MESLEFPCSLFGGVMLKSTSYAPEIRVALPAYYLPAELSSHNSCRHGLQDLEQHINFEAFRPRLDELCHYSEKGRPHYDVVKMFRILILQTLYDLSDEDMKVSPTSWFRRRA